MRLAWIAREAEEGRGMHPGGLSLCILGGLSPNVTASSAWHGAAHPVALRGQGMARHGCGIWWAQMGADSVRIVGNLKVSESFFS